ncbi:hypothetical protein L6452_18860 [Arctium lappa]|uniref:Uncharacterized protein n=1 Tax=Arctium lappa TaxID=4217 RepID=A0ACB9C7H5_ARCLA|nr:hypothetical protein L6452_18860 [Arctium lappa]
MTCESDRGNVALSQSPNAYRGHLAARDYAPATMPWHNRQAILEYGYGHGRDAGSGKGMSFRLTMDVDDVMGEKCGKEVYPRNRERESGKTNQYEFGKKGFGEKTIDRWLDWGEMRMEEIGGWVTEWVIRMRRDSPI